jgi:hypothetical protein
MREFRMIQSDHPGNISLNETKVALVLLIKSAMDQLDEISVLGRQGCSAQLSRQLLAETCGVLRELTGDQTELYFSTLLALSESFGLSGVRSVSEEYVEHVAPAKRHFVSTIRERLRAAIG